MINEVLVNLAYLFYPKNICPWDENEKYLQTEEYKRLSTTIDFFNSDGNKKLRSSIKAEFEEDLVLKDFEDFSRLDNQDRCVKFFLNVFEDGKLFSITLYLSILSPYYVIVSMKHSPSPFFSQLKINELELANTDTRKLKDLILDVESIVEKKLLYQKFPQELIHSVIDNISFQGIYLGHFKMYNAFFNNENI
ncbi:hypothetical protein LPB87_11980 [Flavobacterium sp. EDS]|uniref:hypothetical protein n=1 Tax=Flavobacterium sp. EDS TaxID=2897328 RepID=UPI001E644914|nr:hypothetical protein [Flavobacterium sp. EDS]MCD0475112.1 hypothetical protein [Flavobacterium sp. EDS]